MAAVLGERAEPAKAFAVFARTTAPTLTAVLQWASVGDVNGRGQNMRRATAVIIVAAAAMLGSADASFAQFAPDATRSPELSAPSNPRTGRARTRIRVTPAYPYRTYSTTYPVPYTYEYPGPGHVRECGSWLAVENRPSGTVIVPRMRCWWQPGRDLGP
ncbi:MAG: hypothetical protein ACJ8F0_22855 [Xanthobacteraceae bacterium]|jgi:hypothetical protein